MSKFKVKFSKVNQVIYSSAPISMPNIKALAQILLEISCTQDFQILFSKGHNSEKGHNAGMKKIYVNYFFMRNMCIKFQNPSMYHSKVSQKCNRRTYVRTHTQTDKPKAVCPSNFSKVWSIIKLVQVRIHFDKACEDNVSKTFLYIMQVGG